MVLKKEEITYVQDKQEEHSGNKWQSFQNMGKLFSSTDRIETSGFR